MNLGPTNSDGEWNLVCFSPVFLGKRIVSLQQRCPDDGFTIGGGKYK